MSSNLNSSFVSIIKDVHSPSPEFSIKMDGLKKSKNVLLDLQEWEDSEADAEIKSLICDIKEKVLKANREDRKKDKKDPKDKLIDNILLEKKPVFQSLGLGIHNDKWYYGTVLHHDGRDFDAVIASDKKIYVDWGPKKGNDITEGFGLKYRDGLFSDCIDGMWSNESILQFRKGEAPEVSIKKLFNIIRNLNERYIYHTDPEIHDHIACDIISTYCYPLFETKGRTFFIADKESGKSKQATIYQLLAFNPVMSGDLSPASFYRIIESTGGTVIIDDFDNVSEEQQKAMIQHMRVGYRKDQKAVRSDGKDNRPKGYNVYSPCVVNNTVGLDEITASRCNQIRMLRVQGKITTEKLVRKNKMWGEIRDQLHLCVMQNHEEIKKSYDEVHEGGLSARALERVEGILAIAKIVGGDVYDRLIKWEKRENEQRALRDLDTDWEFLACKEIGMLFNENYEEVEFTAGDLSDHIFPSDEFGNLSIKMEKDKAGFTRWIGKKLSRMPLFKSRILNGHKRYKITRENFDLYVEAREYKKYLDIQPTSPTSPTSSTSSTSSTSKNQKGGLSGLGGAVTPPSPKDILSTKNDEKSHISEFTSTSVVSEEPGKNRILTLRDAGFLLRNIVFKLSEGNKIVTPDMALFEAKQLHPSFDGWNEDLIAKLRANKILDYSKTEGLKVSCLS